MGCTATTAMLTIHNMATWMVGEWGTSAVCEQWGKPLAAGDKLASYCLTEPGAGSDLAAITTRCWQDEDGHWRLQGQKVWTSLAHESEWIFVIARSTPGSVGREGLSFLLVPLEQPGIEIRVPLGNAARKRATEPTVIQNKSFKWVTNIATRLCILRLKK